MSCEDDTGLGTTIQRDVAEWHRAALPAVSRAAQALKVLEEAVELCHAAYVPHGDIERRFHQAHQGEAARGCAGLASEVVQVEAGDVAVALLALAGLAGFDLVEAARRRLKWNKGREVKP